MKLPKNSKGLTLIEVMVVLAILAAVIAAIAPKLGGNKNALREAIRQFSALSRNLQSMARLQGKIFRIAIQIDEKKGHKFWVESSPKGVQLMTEEQIEEEEKRNRFNTKSDEEKRPPNQASFSRDSAILKNPIQLPTGLVFKDVEVSTFEDPIEEGMAYIHYFPHGYVDQAAIHFEYEEKSNWTIIIHPLTGQSVTVTKYVPLKDITDQ